MQESIARQSHRWSATRQSQPHWALALL